MDFDDVFLIGVIIGVLILVVIGIGAIIYQDISYGEKEGIIIDKYYEKAYTTHSMMYVGKVLIPRNHYHPESWNLKLEKEVNGQKKTIVISVNKSDYDTYNVGDYYKKGECEYDLVSDNVIYDRTSP